jgi:hypothetical protein
MEEIAEESYDNMEAYLNIRSKANEKIHKGGEMIDGLYKLFAQKHNVLLSEREDKMSIQIDKVNKVFDYYENVYLIFFKSNIQESYLIKALNSKDFSSAEQNRNALKDVSSAGLNKLDTVKSFQNDRSLILACRRTLEFYKIEASDKMVIVMDFMMKNENFEKLKKTIGSKDPMLRSKDETDEYNTAIKEYNIAVRKYNSVCKVLDQQRSTKVTEWNTSVHNYLEKYVPKYN